MKRLLIADAHVVFCELFAARITVAPRVFREIRWVAGIKELEKQLKAGTPDVVLLGTNLSPKGLSEPLQMIRKAAFGVKATPSVLVLDDRLKHANLSIAVDFKTQGYYLKTSTFLEIEESLDRIAQGVLAFCPDSAPFLVLSGEGVVYRRQAIGEPFASLSPREYQTAIHLANGRTTAQCAEILGVTESTVNNYKWRLMRKLNIRRSVDLTLLAHREGLLTGD